MGKIKIGRNEPCPCGSGKKFKKCCLNKSQDQRFAETMSKSMHNIKNEARIKRCLHPKQEECDGKIVKAHAIQNNRILNKISENGMLVTMDGNLHNIFQTSDIKGRKVATAPSQQKWTQKSFKKRNESQYFVNLLKPTAFIPRFA